MPFAAVERHLPYFSALGISHLYLSPIWKAAPGSLHGYDVLDHAAVSDELGGLPGFLQLPSAARTRGIGLICDIVPNHVYIGDARHPWWRDVLRSGPESPFAQYFDIDWSGRGELPAGVVLLPVLGEPFGVTLESGVFALDFEDGEMVIRYHHQSFPLRMASYGAVFGVPPPDIVTQDPASVADALRGLEALQSATVEGGAALRAEFANVVRSSASVRAWLSHRCELLSGVRGDPSSFDELERILHGQHYRLANWRVSGEQVNYRRFFDINELAATRQEHAPAFQDTHRLVAELASSGHLSGLRVDHVDGLNRPGAYLQSLQESAPEVVIWVEKILAQGEVLPEWGVAGTTGYDFAAVAQSIFRNAGGAAQVRRLYRDFTGVDEGFERVAFRSRHWIADRAFDGDVAGLAAAFHRIAQASRLYADTTLRSLREALVALLASMPRYRTYLEDGPMSAVDTAAILDAAEKARFAAPDLNPRALAFIVESMTGAGGPEESQPSSLAALTRRFQQIAAPVMAKGVEDTAFYRHTPLLSDNEVGSSPGQPPLSLQEAHSWFTQRAEHWPLSMNATTTHDTKRSEDARMRLAALTQVPKQWRREVLAWRRMNASRKVVAGQTQVPNPQTEYYLYETLVAVWDGEGGPALVARVCDHMLKAAKEEKVWTSWIAPDEPAEAALETFVRNILHPRRGSAFRARLSRFVDGLTPQAEANSLALLALKCLAPGLPDFFQGAEDWVFTLTDPDNRRPVDYESLETRLSGLSSTRTDAKLSFSRELLALRRRRPALFSAGDYEPVPVPPALEDATFAFVRSHDGDSVACAARLAEPASDALLEDGWQWDRASGRAWFDWATGKQVAPGHLFSALAGAPVSILTTFPRTAT